MGTGLVCQKSSVVQSVYVTNEYRFMTIGGNRNVNDLHVERLKRSMEEHCLVAPIIVNEKDEIIDGQHRYEALKDLGLPVYYIVCEGYGLSEVQRLNQVFRAWNVDDFLDGYANQGREHYIRVKQFKEQYNWGSTKMAIVLLNRHQREEDVVAAFKNGTYKVDDMEWAINFVTALEAFQRYFPDYKTTNFVKAFRLLYECPRYVHKTMKKKLEYQGGLFEKRTTIGQYAELLTDIYNARLTVDKRIYYLDGDVK